MFIKGFIATLKKILLIYLKKVKCLKIFARISFSFKDQSFWSKNQLLKIETFKTHLMLNTFSHMSSKRVLFISNLIPLDLKWDIENLINLSKYRSVSKLYRVTAWVCRFIKNLKTLTKRKNILLSPLLMQQSWKSLKFSGSKKIKNRWPKTLI